MTRLAALLRGQLVGCIALVVALAGVLGTTYAAAAPVRQAVVQAAGAVSHDSVLARVAGRPTKAKRGKRGRTGPTGPTGAPGPAGPAGIGPGFEAGLGNVVDVPSPFPAPLLTLSALPAGSYAIAAKLNVIGQGGPTTVTCSLAAAGLSDNAITTAGQATRATMSMQLMVTLPGPGSAVLSCSRAGDPVSVNQLKIDAVRLTSATVTAG